MAASWPSSTARLLGQAAEPEVPPEEPDEPDDELALVEELEDDELEDDSLGADELDEVLEPSEDELPDDGDELEVVPRLSLR